MYNLKTVKNTHGGMILFGVFHVFWIVQMAANLAKYHKLKTLLNSSEVISNEIQNIGLVN